MGILAVRHCPARSTALPSITGARLANAQSGRVTGINPFFQSHFIDTGAALQL